MGPLEHLEKDLIQINKTDTGRRAFLGSLPILLASCATSRHRGREGDNKGQATSMTVHDEKRMASQYLPKMKKDYPPLKSSKIQSYIGHLGRKIATKNGLEGSPYNYNFTVVDTKMVNAFALPAGTIFVTAPLIQMAHTEAELAGVIGHEIGHVKSRHTAERMEMAKRGEKKSILYGVGGALLIQKYSFMANSREDEMEADRIGFRTSVGAGYHSNYVGLFYKRLLEMEKKFNKNKNSILSSFADAMSTHPPSEERVKQMNDMTNKFPSREKSLISTRGFEHVQKLIKKMKS